MKKKYLVSVWMIIASLTLHGSDESEKCGLIELPRFDWGAVMVAPQEKNGGDQVLHFNTTNKIMTEETKEFVAQFFADCEVLTTDADTLRFASANIRILDGMIMEMGAGTGRTTNFIAALNPKKTVYGFDSFQGLPTDWNKIDYTTKKGMFAFNDELPKLPVLKNVTLYKEWFENVLPVFISQILKDTPIAFLHVDCDVYSSTQDVFNALEDNIQAGTIIVFDEFYNYKDYENNEYKAFIEFIERTGKKFKYIAYNRCHQQVVVEML